MAKLHRPKRHLPELRRGADERKRVEFNSYAMRLLRKKDINSGDFGRQMLEFLKKHFNQTVPDFQVIRVFEGFYEHMTIEKIAEHANMSPPTVRKYLSMARLKSDNKPTIPKQRVDLYVRLNGNGMSDRFVAKFTGTDLKVVKGHLRKRGIPEPKTPIYAADREI
jgi:hypothetical protein